MCPVIFIFDGFAALGDEALSRFEFKWGRNKVAMAGGLAHFYNHSDTPNIELVRDRTDRVIRVYTLRRVYVGEELQHKYMAKPWWKTE